MDIYEFHQSGKTYTIAQLKADVEYRKIFKPVSFG